MTSRGLSRGVRVAGKVASCSARGGEMQAPAPLAGGRQGWGAGASPTVAGRPSSAPSRSSMASRGTA
eukprot:11575077-Alexandrium_andersonii.AAC.1